jgi:hypothetical protein
LDPGSYAVGGTVAGLGAGKSVVLQNNGGDDLTVDTNDAFSFAALLVDGSSFAVTVATQPAGQTCVVSNGSGTVRGADVTAAAVDCTDNPPASVSISGGTSVLVDGTLQLTAAVADAQGTPIRDSTITWQVDDSTVATISPSGLLTGLSVGGVTVTASTGSVSGTSSVMVVTALPWLPSGLTGHFATYVQDYPGRVQWGWGYSVYSAVFPVKPNIDDYTQLGWGTFMIPNFMEDENDVMSPRPDNVCQPDAAIPSLFQSNEGGVGSWGNMRFPSAMPKFLIAATADCYSSGVGGPAYKPGEEPLADDSLYFAQLSNRLLLPPDRVNFSELSAPAFLGIGWIALPIIPEGYSPYGISTGGNSWTLFFNAANFAGPVGFFTPAFWTALDALGGTSAGYGLDRRTMLTGGWDLEVGFTAAFAVTLDGVDYVRIPRMTFGADEDRKAVLFEDARYYEKAALWDGVEAWMAGGDPVTQVDVGATRTLPFQADGFYEAYIEADHGLVDYSGMMDIAPGLSAGGGSTWGLQWSDSADSGVIPEYYKKVGEIWQAIPASEVPPQTGLAAQQFPQLAGGTIAPLSTESDSPWTSANWAAGPFSASLPDGSTVDYVWYRFVDQPAIARLNLSADDEARIQAWVESLHGHAAFSIPPPTGGTLVTIAPGHIVSPPAGLEVGYVPIVIAQY